MFWEYTLKTRSGDEEFTFMRNWVERTRTTYPGEYILRHSHADGGAELTDQRSTKILLDEYKTTLTWSLTDTPELNAVSERNFRTLGGMTFTMLADSGLPKSFFWRDAYVTAWDIIGMLPTGLVRAGCLQRNVFLVGELQTYPSFDDGGVKPVF